MLVIGGLDEVAAVLFLVLFERGSGVWMSVFVLFVLQMCREMFVFCLRHYADSGLAWA